MFEKLKRIPMYIFTKWLLLSVFIGSLVGLAGTAFHYCLHFSGDIFGKFNYLIFALPVAGLIIVWLYSVCGFKTDRGINVVFTAIKNNERISPLVAPLIFVATCLTILTGGSAGREGAALQLGGSLSALMSKFLRLNDEDYCILVMCGMAAGFSSLFGTAVAAAVFAMEMISVGRICFSAIVPCAVSSAIAYHIASLLGVHATSFEVSGIPQLSTTSLVSVVILAGLCGIVSILFCITMHKTKHYAVKFIKNPYLRVLAGAGLIIALTLILRTNDYNGAGMGLVEKAIAGEAVPYAFILKLLFTAITLSVGFKGGEIVPAFFVGSTFGCVVAPFIGLEPSFGAAIGLVSVFCGVTNCPITSLILSVELFGSNGFILFLISCAVSYMLSGYYSLYGEQVFVNSKFGLEKIELRSK